MAALQAIRDSRISCGMAAGDVKPQLDAALDTQRKMVETVTKTAVTEDEKLTGAAKELAEFEQKIADLKGKISSPRRRKACRRVRRRSGLGCRRKAWPRSWCRSTRMTGRKSSRPRRI